MASFPPVEVVVRTLELFEALNRQPISTVAVLHRQTGIPKPSIIRLLQTLEGCGYVRHAPTPGAYYITAKVKTLASGYHSEPQVVEVLGPMLEELTADIKWPTATSMPDGDAMVVRYSTIPNSPLSLAHSTMHTRLSLVSSAAGRTYLAFCDEHERNTLIDLVAEASRPEDAWIGNRSSLDATLELVRRRGYGLRDPAIDPATRTMAVPVFNAVRVVGIIAVTWFTSAMKAEEAAERYFARMEVVANDARKALSDPGAATQPHAAESVQSKKAA